MNQQSQTKISNSEYDTLINQSLKNSSAKEKTITKGKIISIAIAGKIKKPVTPKPSIQLIESSKLKILLIAEIKNKAEIRILPIKSNTFTMIKN